MTFRQAETFLLSKNSPPAVPLNPTGPILTRYVSLSGSRTGISQDGISKGPRNKQRPVRALPGLMIEELFYNQWLFRIRKTLSASGRTPDIEIRGDDFRS